MKKISFKNIFKKSEKGGSKKNKILIPLLILILVGGAFYLWGYPLLFPESPVKSTVASVTVPASESFSEGEHFLLLGRNSRE